MWRCCLVHLLSSQGPFQANGRLLKTFLTYCLVFLIMSLSVGVWLVSVPTVNFLKRRAGSEMQQSSKQIRLRLRPDDAFKRVGTDELLIEGYMYDVVSEQQRGGCIEFVVYRDELETYFLQFLTANMGTVDSSEDTSSPLKMIVHTILRLEFYPIPLYSFNALVPFVGLASPTDCLVAIPVPPFCHVLLRPPRTQSLS
jgi:hypothetical protein